MEHKTSNFQAKSPEMDPGIWSRLPEHLLEHVLSLLPLKTLLRLRPTCKHFKSLIFSPNFVAKHASSSSKSPFSSFLLFSHPQLRHLYHLYDTILNAWRRVPLSPSPPLSCDAAGAVLLSISHGLLCFSLPHSSSFLVCNLLQKSSRVVNFPKKNFRFELFTLVPSPNGYKLFMLCSCSGLSNNAFVYDSTHNLWHQFDRVDSFLGDNFLQEGVFYNGCLYFTSPEPFSILCFDFETWKWWRPAIRLPHELTFSRLASDGSDKFYLIGGTGRDGISRGMKLWELGGDGENWLEIDSVPEMMRRKFMCVCYHNYEHVYCFWHQGLICVCCYNWPEVLYYRVARRSWHWLPKCPSLPEKWSCGFRWFSLVPELFAFV
ncbi:F-box/kelch-repeat protein At5g43190-like [Actinidia eriantha]|uniref:F-box/kelch-repeat protein At5g43190-like n=1 Tax=Actinidia eriantha TaxID=165200 RepID=UPI0025830745|nr:F-box/kelch-repeat protein At5g43190-like [Actinidia eriantha]